MKILIAIAFAGILGALALAGVFMMREGRDGKPKSGAMMRALAVRVGLSILLFAFILLSWRLGWIHPTGVPVGR
ncbi:MAG TPA: twin transmembrane helix small protein [Caldimonas sp.]